MTTDSVVITDLETNIIGVNEATVKMFGTDDKGELIGRKALDLIAPEDREKAIARMEEVLEKGYLRTEEYHIITRDGSRIPMEMSAALMKDADGRPIGFVAVSRDIAERKRMEEELLKADKLESVGILAGGIAHDFNNILTAILGNISLARLLADPGKISERLVEAEKACMQAKDLTQQVLTFARGGAPIKKTASIREILKDSASFALKGYRNHVDPTKDRRTNQNTAHHNSIADSS